MLMKLNFLSFPLVVLQMIKHIDHDDHTLVINSLGWTKKCLKLEIYFILQMLPCTNLCTWRWSYGLYIFSWNKNWEKLIKKWPESHNWLVSIFCLNISFSKWKVYFLSYQTFKFICAFRHSCQNCKLILCNFDRSDWTFPGLRVLPSSCPRLSRPQLSKAKLRG